MSDNTALPSASGGDVIRTDDVGAAKIQVVKLATGATGVDGGLAARSNPIPVEDWKVRRLLEAILFELQEGNEHLRRIAGSNR